MLLGVEVEFNVVGDPKQGTEYVSEYPVMDAYDKHIPKGNTHRKHGHLVRAVDVVSNDSLRVGYDNTASPWPGSGFEITGPPTSIEENAQIWGWLYDSWLMKYLIPDQQRCGMHVHVTDDRITPAQLRTINGLINNNYGHGEFIKYVAGRYDTSYCQIYNCTEDMIQNLFHSYDCTSDRKGKKIDLGESPYNGGHTWCCHRMREFRRTHYPRGALNLTPTKHSGHIEIRMFTSPQTKIKFLSNLQFVAALLEYSGSPTVNDFCVWLQESMERKGQYRYLFKHLRDGGYVQGLMPRLQGV